MTSHASRGKDVVTSAIPSEAQGLVAEIAKRFRPRRIVLFGSHATGQADAGSDVDLLIVMDTPLRPLQQAAAISRALDHRTPVDILVRPPRSHPPIPATSSCEAFCTKASWSMKPETEQNPPNPRHAWT